MVTGSGGWTAVRLTLAFLSEIAALVTLSAWGGRTGGWGLAVALPLVAAVLWGAFAAPRARFRVPAAALAVTVGVLGGGVLALAALGHPWWALVLGAAAVLGATATAPPVLTETG
ncbi:hypothetical protein DQ237_05390 [Blastococcus sp. TF02-8]|uniref:YrdB family protein n=1 Tax=Blastococcus sp. TF02-8 TaxID=2250574 RepID=UPI000DEB0E1B|nr:YrdB family protein [Blastococcus sp. TF02-8]RBY97032.1 hypothetical protein DQ237_05390 [Blastococcus sp. TF02-8]